jgi:hypothetical protein
VNRLRDQFFACTSFALNQYGGIGGCDAFNFLEDSFERKTFTYDSLELAVFPVLFTRPKCFEVSHKRLRLTLTTKNA